MTSTPPIRAVAEHTSEVPQRSFANQGTAFNRSIIDFVQWNVLSGFELAKKITEAKSLGEVVELQMAYWQKQFGLTSHAKQLGVTPLGRIAADVGALKEASKMQDQVSRSTSDAKAVSVVNTNLRKRKPGDKKSIALAQSKVHRKTSGARIAAHPVKTKKTSRNKKPRKGKN